MRGCTARDAGPGANIIWLDILSELVSERWWQGLARGEIDAETWLTLWKRDRRAAELVNQDLAISSSRAVTMGPSLGYSPGAPD